MTGPHALMAAVTATTLPLRPSPAAAHHASLSGGLVHDVIGWLIAGVVVFLVVKFVKGQRNKAKAAAEAWASAVAKASAAAHASAVAGGGDARSAIQLNVGAGAQPADDQFAHRVACLVVALLRAELPDGQWDHYEHIGADVSANAGARRRRVTGGNARGVGPGDPAFGDLVHADANPLAVTR